MLNWIAHALISFQLICTNISEAKEVFVGTNGNDDNSGTFKTLLKPFHKVSGKAIPGEWVIILEDNCLLDSQLCDFLPLKH